TGCPACNHGKIDTFSEFHFLGVHAQNFFAAFHIGKVDGDLSIEASGPQKRWVENVRAVCRRDNDDAFLRVEPIHLDKQRIKRLLPFIVAAADAVTAMTTDRINFVDENDAGRGLLALLEHVAYAACTDANKHLDEIRSADRKERYIRFAGDRAS